MVNQVESEINEIIKECIKEQYNNILIGERHINKDFTGISDELKYMKKDKI